MNCASLPPCFHPFERSSAPAAFSKSLAEIALEVPASRWPSGLLNARRVTNRGGRRRFTLFGFQSSGSAAPKLINRPPEYRLHKSTGHAVVSVHGKVIQLGPFGSQASHVRYQEEISNWRALRQKQEVEGAAEPEVTRKELHARSMRGYPVLIDERALAYLDYARGYYKKNGRVPPFQPS